MHGPLGGDRRSHVIEAQAETILKAFRARRDMTLLELLAELAERGLHFGYGTLWRFFDRRGYTRKKDRARGRAKPPGHPEPARGLVRGTARPRSRTPGLRR
jgi:transposase